MRPDQIFPYSKTASHVQMLWLVQTLETVAVQKEPSTTTRQGNIYILILPLPYSLLQSEV